MSKIKAQFFFGPSRTDLLDLVRAKHCKLKRIRKLFTTCLTLLQRQRKILASSNNRTHTFVFLNRCSTHWAIEPTGIGGEFILFKCTKYLRDDLTLAIDDLQCFNSVTESSLETYENYSQRVITMEYCSFFEDLVKYE